MRRIGEQLNDGGGMALMSYAHQVYTKAYGDAGAPRLVDMWWGGIGQWLG